MVEFAYTGELTFTAENFILLKKAIQNLKMKFIDEESLSKIEEDIEQTKEGGKLISRAGKLKFQEILENLRKS